MKRPRWWTAWDHVLRVREGPLALILFALTGAASSISLYELDEYIASFTGTVQIYIYSAVFCAPVIWKGLGRYLKVFILVGLVWALTFVGSLPTREDVNDFYLVDFIPLSVVAIGATVLTFAYAFAGQSGRFRPVLPLAFGFVSMVLVILFAFAVKPSSSDMPEMALVFGCSFWAAMALGDWRASLSGEVKLILTRKETDPESRQVEKILNVKDSWRSRVWKLLTDDVAMEERWLPQWRQGWRGVAMGTLILAASVSVVLKMPFENSSLVFLFIVAFWFLPFVLRSLLAWFRAVAVAVLPVAPIAIWVDPGALDSPWAEGHFVLIFLCPSLGFIAGFGRPISLPRVLSLILCYTFGILLCFILVGAFNLKESFGSMLLYACIVWGFVLLGQSISRPDARNILAIRPNLPTIRHPIVRACLDTPLPRRGLLAFGMLALVVAMAMPVVVLRSLASSVGQTIGYGEIRPTMMKVPKPFFYSQKDIQTGEPWTFSISQTEVLRGQFEALITPIVSDLGGEREPAKNVDPRDIMSYCDQLSATEGLDPCYEGSLEKIRFSALTGKVAWSESLLQFPKDLKRCNGYRLPTEEEWSFAITADGLMPPTPPVSAGGQIMDVIDENPWGLLGLSNGVEEWVHTDAGQAICGTKRACVELGSVNTLDSVGFRIVRSEFR